ncbi:hypothetical protein P152DRAFT_452942 [Eremomyces bilateralis CBS 781.70]|uniref:Uncharacterized protein n=1 Tax=Eremomyces bilateralis CBS 781.70 TaxID=1392243 RepID=A0A6G1FR97_9PEZI|nr:uncharacterized protein P152DRAFT_452942 [Eremomyces bilateralis CBS 781.70]KAF1808365.1 hypothetical protein P152DRAFT_452942 [Eremomyces bilateralis CBS 781.70]
MAKTHAQFVRSERNASTSYSSPNGVHMAKIYPLKSPNGSNIIVYGHDSGIKVLWHGGRPHKRPRTDSHNRTSDASGLGASTENAFMILDSDEENSPEPAVVVPPAEFETEEPEWDPSEPYPHVVQEMDISVGAEVMDIAFPPIPVSGLRDLRIMPSLFERKVVVTVACSDSYLRIYSFPLVPPTDEQLLAGKSALRISVVHLGGPLGHQQAPNSVSMTWTSRDIHHAASQSEIGPDVVEEDGYATERPAGEPRGGKSQTEPMQFDLLLASCSDEVSGLLLLFRVPIDPENDDLESAPPFQRLYLSRAALKVFFSPTIFPSKRHSYLMVVERQGSVRIYDPFSQLRRDTGNRQQNIDNPSPRHGAWLMTYSTRYAASGSPRLAAPGSVQRKNVLDAQWVLNGTGIFALLPDGQWGVWRRDLDIHGSGRPATTLSEFALSGRLRIPKDIGSPPSISKPQFVSGGRPSLAPMTPNTRKTKQTSLFSSGSSDTRHLPRGGISVSQYPTLSGMGYDESVVLWYGDHVYAIPSFNGFWNRAKSKGSTKGNILSVQTPSPPIVDLRVDGSSLVGVGQFPAVKRSDGQTEASQRDLLVVDARQFVVWSPSSFQSALHRGNETLESEEEDYDMVDETLLDRSELDVGGIDRYLDILGQKPPPGRRVGFAA